MKEKICFLRAHKEAKIPTKRKEDAGYDIYMLPQEEELIMEPGETKILNTGLKSAFSSRFVLVGKERGSTGTKGMRFGAGVIDSGYRGEIMVPLNNSSNKIILLYPDHLWTPKDLHNKETDLMEEYGMSITSYPQSKAIGQLLLVPVPETEIEEVDEETYNLFESERGAGKLGSSGK